MQARVVRALLDAAPEDLVRFEKTIASAIDLSQRQVDRSATRFSALQGKELFHRFGLFPLLYELERAIDLRLYLARIWRDFAILLGFAQHGGFQLLRRLKSLLGIYVKRA